MTPMRPGVYRRESELPEDFSTAGLPAMAYPGGVVVCPPDHFDVIDEKNPFMTGNAGSVDRESARRQWVAMCAAFDRAGVRTHELLAVEGAEDMVFCANTAFLGIDAGGAKTCAPARMTFESRRAEVAPIVAWCESNGYRLANLHDPSARFEGSGDAIWHPARRLVWGGVGPRTEECAYASVAAEFGVPVLLLRLVDPTYYHLDTCFCPIDERTALVYAPALNADAMGLVRRAFERVLEVDAEEARRFACNATAFFGRVVVMDRRAEKTSAQLRSLGYETIEIDTGEFLKSGGSVYCMKNASF